MKGSLCGAAVLEAVLTSVLAIARLKTGVMFHGEFSED